MHNFKELQIWQKAMTLVTKIYSSTAQFDSEHKFGLVSQMQRAAVSIPSNIAEGASKNGTKEFIRFLNIANGSSAELLTQILICENLNLITKGDVECLQLEIEEIQKMNHGLRNTLLKNL